MSDYIEDPEVNQLIYEKGQELIAISRIRIQKLEEQLRAKEQSNEELRGKLAQLQEDFNYNLGLIDGRDEELTELEGRVEALKTALHSKEDEIEELHASLQSAEDRVRSFDDRRRSNERFLQENRETLREQLATLQWEKADFLKKKDEEIKALKQDFEEIVREKELELVEIRKNSAVSYESALRSKEEQIQTLKSQLAQSQAQALSFREQAEEHAGRSQAAEMLEDRVRIVQEQNE